MISDRYAHLMLAPVLPRLARQPAPQYTTPIPMSAKRNNKEFDIIEPIGKRVVVRKDDNKRETRSGIVLPDSHEIPVITGRVIAISKQIENDEDHTIRQYDKVLFDPREAIPVELEHDNRLFVVHIDRVLAIFRKSRPAGDSVDPGADNAEGQQEQ
jgi:chaperonin GroES